MSAPARAPEAMGQSTEYRPATVTEGYSAVSFVPTDMPQTAVSVYEDMIVIDTIMPPTRYLPPTLSMSKLAAQMQTDLLTEIQRLGLGNGSQVGSIAHPRSEAAEAEPPRGMRKTGEQLSSKLRPKDKRRAELGIRSLRGEPYLSYFPPPKAGDPTVVNGVSTTCPCVCCQSGCSGPDPKTGRLAVIQSALAPEPDAQPEPAKTAAATSAVVTPVATGPATPDKITKVYPASESIRRTIPASDPINSRPSELLARTTDDISVTTVYDDDESLFKNKLGSSKGITRITLLNPRKPVSQLKTQRSAPNLRQIKVNQEVPPLRSLISEEARTLKPAPGHSALLREPQRKPVQPPVPQIPVMEPTPKAPSAPQLVTNGPSPDASVPPSKSLSSVKPAVHGSSVPIPIPNAGTRQRAQGFQSSSPPEQYSVVRRPATHSTVTMRSTPKTPPPLRITPPRRADMFDPNWPYSTSAASQVSLKTLPTPGLSLSSHSAHSSPGSRCEATFGNSPPPFLQYDNRNEPRIAGPNKLSHAATRLLDAARAEIPPPLPENAATTVARNKAESLGLQPPLNSVGSRIRVISGNSPLLRSPAL